LRIAPDHGIEALAGAPTIVIPGSNGRHGGHTGGGMNRWLQILRRRMK
jgi:hypothetical protein